MVQRSAGPPDGATGGGGLSCLGVMLIGSIGVVVLVAILIWSDSSSSEESESNDFQVRAPVRTISEESESNDSQVRAPVRTISEESESNDSQVRAPVRTISEESESNDSQVRAPIRASVKEVFAEYQANEARANLQYMDRDLILSFEVHRIGDDHVEQTLGLVERAYLKLSTETLVTLEKRDTGEANCRVEGFSSNFLLEFDCR